MLTTLIDNIIYGWIHMDIMGMIFTGVVFWVVLGIIELLVGLAVYLAVDPLWEKRFRNIQRRIK